MLSWLIVSHAAMIDIIFGCLMLSSSFISLWILLSSSTFWSTFTAKSDPNITFDYHPLWTLVDDVEQLEIRFFNPLGTYFQEIIVVIFWIIISRIWCIITVFRLLCQTRIRRRRFTNLFGHLHYVFFYGTRILCLFLIITSSKVT